MFFRQGVNGLVASAMGLATVVAGASIQKDIAVRNAPGMTSGETVHAVREVVAGVSRRSNETIVKQDSYVLDHCWQDATIFAVGSEGEKGLPGKDNGNAGVSGSLEVTCVECYIRGKATAKLSIGPTFDVERQIGELTDNMKEEIENITDTTKDWIKDSATDLWDSFFEDGVDIDDFELEPLDIDFDIETPDFPEVGMGFQFDGIDIYLEMNTVLSASTSYTFPLFVTETPLGLGIGADNFVGVIFAVELYINVAADDIDMNSGLHLSLADGLALDMELFGEDIADMTFNGGSFEFLPVTVQGPSGGSLTAGLRISISAGIELSSDKFGIGPDISGGISAQVYANLAQFNTKFITPDDDNDDDEEDDDCALRVEQSFEVNVGAKAGASVAIEALTFGPAPETSTPIFYTTLANICASTSPGFIPSYPTGSSSPSSSVPASSYSSSSIPPTPTPTPTLAPRADDDSTTLTTSTTQIFTAQACVSPGLINCPASLQTTTKKAHPTVLTTVIPSSDAEDFVWPTAAGGLAAAAVTTDLPSPRVFGDAVQGIQTQIKGSPVSYVPPPPPPPPEPTETTEKDEDEDAEVQGQQEGDDEKEGVDGEDGEGAGENKKLIIGLSLGLGLPVLAGIAAGVFFCLRGRNGGGKYAALSDPAVQGQRGIGGDTSYGGVAGRGGSPDMASIGGSMGAGGRFEPYRGSS